MVKRRRKKRLKRRRIMGTNPTRFRTIAGPRMRKPILCRRLRVSMRKQVRQGEVMGSEVQVHDTRAGQGRLQMVWPDIKAVGSKFGAWKRHYRVWDPCTKGLCKPLDRQDEFDRMQHEVRIAMIHKAGGKIPMMVFEVECEDIHGGGLYDTGAMVSLMSRGFYERIGAPQLWAYNKRMVGAMGFRFSHSALAT